MTEPIINGHDVAFFDLDGVIYLGPVAVPGAVEGVADVIAGGSKVMFVTNNAARSAQAVADHLCELGFPTTADGLITSAQVAVAELERILPPGSLVLVAGTQNLVDLVRHHGFDVTDKADDKPVAVLQGYDPAMTWPRLDEAGLAVQQGAQWFGTNDDATRPTNRGLVPGAGAALDVVGLTVPGEPTVFGKPHAPMLDFAVKHTGAQHPIFIGDRLDTDIAGGNRAGMPSLLVFSGAHGKQNLVDAVPQERPTYIGSDMRALLQPPRVAFRRADGWHCGDQFARPESGKAVLEGNPADAEAELDAVWALAQLVWETGVDASEALARLTRVR